MTAVDIDLGAYKLGWSDPEDDYVFKPEKGLTEDIIREMSFIKGEPEWMLDFRLRAYRRFLNRPMPTWGGGGLLDEIDFDDIYYYVKPAEEQAKDWDMVPESIKDTYEKLGIPEAERKFLAGVTAQYESEVVYHRNREDLEEMGVLFMDMDSAVREHPELVQEHFGTVIPPNDNKFAALNSAVWSGGSFIYVPPGVHVDQPLQAYFRINSENMGQFERTLIIVDEGGFCHYVEGCSAPVYSTDSLHSAVVEIVVKRGGRCRYTTIQNWSNNVYNLVTKRAAAYADATMEWVDGNLGCLAEGSRVTTPGGVKPIELVTTGEQVLSYDEEAGELCWRTVTAKKYSGMQPVREVRVGARSLRVTDNHPFYSFTYDPSRPKQLGRYRPGYVRADLLDQAIVPVSSIDYGAPRKIELPDTMTVFRSRNQYSDSRTAERERPLRISPGDTTTDELMWLFGLFTGDGSIEVAPSDSGGMRGAKVVFSVPRDDWARARLVEIMDAVMPDTVPTERRDGVTLTWNSADLADLLIGNGFVTGARSKRVPEWVLDLPESQRIAFVAGYLDSDGSTARARRGFSIKSVNRELLEDVSHLLTSLGVPSRIYTEVYEPKTVVVVDRPATARGAHRLEIPADPRLTAAVSPGLQQDLGLQTVSSTRHFRQVGRSQIQLPESVESRTVDSVPAAEVVPTWDIEVEGTGNFVSEGFIVHNSKLTMKYPAVWLMEPGAHGEVLSIAFAGEGQHQDTGAKMVHVAPETTSTILSKSITKGGGRAGYRGLVRVEPGAENAKSFVRCDALILDDESRSDTYPYMEIEEADTEIGHEATVSKVGEEQLFYLMSRGLSEDEATSMVVAGFIEPIVKELPMEYAVEMNRLIELNMAEAGAVG
ncbi:MAG: Fe-S cluster assembly protein SufB [bacterium]|nr:Fe-S cluster assembly protein SufB [bacterium]